MLFNNQGRVVHHLQPGDRVICLATQLWSEFAVVPEENLFPMPDTMTYEEAAAFPVNYVTAYHMLFEFGNLRKGKSVLVHMAAGNDIAPDIYTCN